MQCLSPVSITLSNGGGGHTTRRERNKGNQLQGRFRDRLFLLEKGFHICESAHFAVIREAFQEDFAISFLADAVIQQRKRAAILQGANQPSKALLQCNDGGGNLVVEESVAAVRINGANARCYDR